VIANTETKVAILETINSQVMSSLSRIEAVYKDTEMRFGKKFDGIDDRLDRIESRMWSIMMGMVACFGATLMSMLIHGMGWL